MNWKLLASLILIWIILIGTAILIEPHTTVNNETSDKPFYPGSLDRDNQTIIGQDSTILGANNVVSGNYIYAQEESYGNYPTLLGAEYTNIISEGYPKIAMGNYLNINKPSPSGIYLGTGKGANCTNYQNMNILNSSREELIGETYIMLGCIIYELSKVNETFANQTLIKYNLTLVGYDN
jgi:hypothetical protein